MERGNSTIFTSGDELDVHASQLGTVDEGLAKAEAFAAANRQSTSEVVDPTGEKVARIGAIGINLEALRRLLQEEAARTAIKGDYELVG